MTKSKSRNSSLTKKEKLYAGIGLAIILIVIIILGTIAYNNLFESRSKDGRIYMELEDRKIESGEETKLKLTVTNTGKDLLEGDILIKADDPQAVNITHPDPNVLNVNLYEGESITRILSVTGKTNAIRTDYKIISELVKENKTITSNELILTVTKD